MLGSIGVDGVDLQFAIRALKDVENEHNPFPIRRPVSIEVWGVLFQKPLHPGSIYFHGPECQLALVEPGHQDGFAIRRPLKMLFEGTIFGETNGLCPPEQRETKELPR